MPSRIEELIAGMSHDNPDSGFCMPCRLERAYREEVVPLVEAAKASIPQPFPSDNEEDCACIEAILAVKYLRQLRAALRCFDAPEGITCPGCAEQIGLDDSVCRHCGAILQPSKIHEEPKQ